MGIGLAHWWSSVYRFAATKHFFSILTSSDGSNETGCCSATMNDESIVMSTKLQKTNLYFSNYTQKHLGLHLFVSFVKNYLCSSLRYWNTQRERSISIVCVCPSFCRSHAKFMQNCRYSDLRIDIAKRRNSIHYYLYYRSRMNT